MGNTVSRTFTGSYAGTGTSIGLQACPPSDESPSKIRDAVGFTEQLLNDLHGILSHLESRLDAALTPIPPSPDQTADCNGNAVIASHLLSRIGVVNEGLQLAISRAVSLRQRVEV